MTHSIAPHPFVITRRTLRFSLHLCLFVLAVFTGVPNASASDVDALRELERLEQDVIDDKSAAEAFDQLVATLQSANARSRANAAAIIGRLPFEVNKTTLAKINTKRAGQLLAKLIDDPVQSAQFAAVGALRAYPIAARENLDRLGTLLFRDDDRVARGAARTLGELGEVAAKSTADLIKCLEESNDEDLRNACADALGEIGPPAKDSINALSKCIKRAHGNLRIHAARALGKISRDDNRAANALLDEAEKTDEENVCDLSFAFLEQLAKGSPYACEVLKNSVSSGNARVRTNAVESLKRLTETSN